MNDTDKFIVRISCEPQIKQPFDTNTFVDKILTTRVEKINESVISQLRELMKEKGITEFIGIDESKVLQLIEEHKALEILKEKLGVEMSVDDDFALLFVRIADNQCCIVGSVEGEQNIQALKRVLKYHEDIKPIVPSREIFIKEIMSGRVLNLEEKDKLIKKVGKKTSDLL